MTSRPSLTLPRSVRWRIDLGLLENDNDADGNNNVENDDLAASMIVSRIQARNQQRILDQRKQYDELADRHYKSSSAIEIIHDTDHHIPNSSNSLLVTSSKGHKIPKDGSKSQTKATHAQTKGGSSPMNEDPLSVFAQIEELKVKSEKEKEMEIKKERALAARTQYSIAQQYQNYDQTKLNTKSHALSSSTENDIGAKWSEFYTSREVMDIIEKDVDRLPTDHQVAAFYEKITPPNWKQQQAQSISFDLHGQLKRMSTLIQDESLASSKTNHYDEVLKSCRQQRSNTISQILFVYAKEYPKLGYRQGMHEILSLIYLCLEIDLQCRTNNDEHHQPAQQLLLLDPSNIAHDAFSIFQAIMALLCPAFEVRNVDNNFSSTNVSSTSPMEIIGKETIEKIRVMASDEDLFEFITSMTIPPELYCTRWIRLMFSRDVKGLDNVMLLWDAFFHLISDSNKNQVTIPSEKKGDSNSSNSLMNILQITAASMIIMIRSKLIPTSHPMQQYGYREDDDEQDPNDCIHLLMNYEPVEDVMELIKVVDDMISGKIYAPSKSPQITMEMSDDGQTQDLNFYQNNIYPMNQSHMIPTQQSEPMPNELTNQNVHNPMPYGNDPNYQQGTAYYNSVAAQDINYQNQNQHEGPVFYASNGNNYNQYNYIPQQQYQANDPIRSTIENITGNEAWKKLSGGLSGGLNAVKGAIGSLDYTMQHLTNADSSNVPFASSSSTNNEPPRNNVYNPGLRETNSLPQNSNNITDISNANQNNCILNNQYNGPESIYNPGYRDLENETFEPIETTQPHPNPTVEKRNLDRYNQHTQNILIDTNETLESSNNDENKIVSLEDQFVGGGTGTIESKTDDESSLLADKLESSLLKLSSYLQTQMIQAGSERNPIPKSVWDAMAEIEAVKNDLRTVNKVS